VFRWLLGLEVELDFRRVQVGCLFFLFLHFNEVRFVASCFSFFFRACIWEDEGLLANGKFDDTMMLNREGG
jgi:hypothetical protein